MLQICFIFLLFGEPSNLEQTFEKIRQVHCGTTESLKALRYREKSLLFFPSGTEMETTTIITTLVPENKYLEDDEAGKFLGFDGKELWRNTEDHLAKMGFKWNENVYDIKYPMILYRATPVELESNDTHLIVTVMADKQRHRIFVDKTTLVIQKITAQKEETRFLEFKKIGALLFPIKKEIWAKGKRVFELTYSKIEVNPSLPKDYFEKRE